MSRPGELIPRLLCSAPKASYLQQRCYVELAERKTKRKAMLARLPRNSGDGIYLNEHLVEDGATVFKHARLMGLEGIVSKRRDFPYRSDRTKSWIKVKNPASPRCCAFGWAW